MPDIFDSSKITEKKNKPMPASTKSTTTAEVQPKNHRHVDDYSEVLRAEIPCTNYLASYMPKPVGVSFDNQDTNEHVLLLLRQHPVTLFGKILVTIGLLLLPILLKAIGFGSFLPVNYQFAALSLWYLLVLGYTLEVFLVWFFSVYIITDERIIDVDFTSLIHKDISSAKIDKIEDVTAVTSGALGSIVDYGTVKIQTAAAKTELDFENIPHPARVTRLLNELVLEEERERIEGRVN